MSQEKAFQEWVGIPRFVAVYRLKKSYRKWKRGTTLIMVDLRRFCTLKRYFSSIKQATWLDVEDETLLEFRGYYQCRGQQIVGPEKTVGFLT